jgi:hypothetical protein
MEVQLAAVRCLEEPVAVGQKTYHQSGWLVPALALATLPLGLRLELTPRGAEGTE